MSQGGLRRSKKLRKGFLGGALLFGLVFACAGVDAGEKYGMPSEYEAHSQGQMGSVGRGEQVAMVKSLRKQEDRLFVNGEPFVLKHQTRFEDERGARIGLKDVPLGARIALEYRTGSTLEDSGYGPDVKILTRIRLVEPPPREKPAP